jgi:STE24 endopeptidase
LPSEFEGFFDPAKYRESLAYQSAKSRAALVRETLVTFVTVGFLLAGGLEWLDLWARGFGGGEVRTALIFAGALVVLRAVFALPFSVYDTFVLEARFGFNRSTPATFAGDWIKGLVLGAVIGGPIFAGAVIFFGRFGAGAWLYCWVGLVAIQLLLTFVAPVIFMPLFNKFQPLPEGELKRAIEAYARKEGFEMKGVFTMDGSKRSTKANAYFTGFGRFRRLVLFDTLISQQTVEELTAVVAHEVGHFKLGHILRSLALSIVVSGAMLYGMSRALGSPELASAFGMSQPSVYASLILVSILLGPVMRWFGLLTHGLSRRYEFEADEFARRTYGHAEQLVSALKKLSRESFSDLTPHRLKVWADYTHPPVLKRIEALRRS